MCWRICKLFGCRCEMSNCVWCAEEVTLETGIWTGVITKSTMCTKRYNADAPEYSHSVFGHIYSNNLHVAYINYDQLWNYCCTEKIISYKEQPDINVLIRKLLQHLKTAKKVYENVDTKRI